MIAAVFAIALMAAAPAAGEAAAPANATPTKSAKPDKKDMVCKKEAVLGSRMPQRVCMSKADWDQRATDAKADTDAAQRNQPMRTQ